MRILQREIRGGNRHFAQIDATTRIAAKVFVVIRKNTLHYRFHRGGAADGKSRLNRHPSGYRIPFRWKSLSHTA